MRKFCSCCSKSLTAEKGVRLKHESGQVREFHKACSKKILKEDQSWQPKDELK